MKARAANNECAIIKIPVAVYRRPGDVTSKDALLTERMMAPIASPRARRRLKEKVANVRAFFGSKEEFEKTKEGRTFGTRAADGGVPLPAIRDVMGHRSIQTTERYAHATDEGKRRAVEAIHAQSKKIVTKLSQRKAANR